MDFSKTYKTDSKDKKLQNSRRKRKKIEKT
jgi:hypothetical protein